VNRFLWWKCLDCLDWIGFFWYSGCGHSRYILSIPVVISVTSRKCIAHFEAARHELPHTGIEGPRANWHGNMSCFSGSMAFVSAGQKPQTTKHEPQNLTPTKTCQVSVARPSGRFDVRAVWAQETYPIETCNISGAMLQPQLPFFHVPHVIPSTTL
jgi:hypothetical protein